MLLGIGLYWGEGKKLGSILSISNTDPNLIKYFLYWIEKCFGIDRKDKRIKIYTHFYTDMNIQKELDYWCDALHVNRSQFGKPYIKSSKLSGINYLTYGHGTCQIQLSDAKIKRDVMALIKIFGLVV